MLRTIATLMMLMLLSGVHASDESLRDEALAALGAGEMERAATLYSKLVKADRDDGEAHYRLATAEMALGKLKKAEKHFIRARELGFQAQGADYRLARIDALRGDADKAIAKLHALGDAGFGLIQMVEGNADFAALEDNDDYQAAVTKIRGNRYPCLVDPRHHAFDFWIGEWDVYNGGQLAGWNSIQPILGHCALFEQWTGGGGGVGKSFNYYDPGHDHWRQIWIADSGSFIEFTGEARDGGIYYTATTRNPADGTETLHRFNFSQNDDGSVRQHWMQSTDGGENWNSVWDAKYVRKAM